MSTNGYILNSSPPDEENLVEPNSESESVLNSENYTNGIGVQHTSVSNTVEKAAKMLELLVKTQQQIQMEGNGSELTHAIHAADVKIIAGPNNHTKGSSKVKIKDIVHYSWEKKYYSGNVVAVHMNGHYMAYSIKNQSKNESCTRIVNRRTSQRALLRGMQGQVKDLAFAYSMSQIILAIVDEEGTLFIYQINDSNQDSAIGFTLLVKINHVGKEKCEHCRVSWCQFIPEDTMNAEDNSDEGNLLMEDFSKLLCITHNETVEMIHLDAVSKSEGKEISSASLETGYHKIEEHSKPISEAIFAPDGSALATASLDGHVKFFQVYLQEKNSTPRCLHEWAPHDGKPVTALFFLDNHKDPNPEQAYWKFAVTGTDDNRELKIWCCVDWSCLQVISFQAPSIDSLQPCLKACLDLSAEYLLLSDINRQVLYVLQLHQEPDLSKACIVSVSEFPVILPMLSFAIRRAGIKRVKQLSDPDNLEIGEEKDDSDHDDENDIELASGDFNQQEETVIKLLSVQPKGLQECCIVFPTSHFLPQKNGHGVNLTAMSQESISSCFKDGLSDLSIDRTNDISCPDEEFLPITPMMSVNQIPKKQVLLTPDSFTSSSLNNSNVTVTHISPNTSTTPKSNQVNSNKTTPVSIPLPPVDATEDADVQDISVGTLVNLDEQEPLATSERIQDHEIINNAIGNVQRSQHSSSSSPSREVAEILSPESDANNYKGSSGKEEKITDTPTHYKSTSWPAAPDIDKIAQQSSPRDVKVQSTSKQNSDSSEKGSNEELLIEFRKRENRLESTMKMMLSVMQDQQEELKRHKSVIDELQADLNIQRLETDKKFVMKMAENNDSHEAKMKKIVETCLASNLKEQRVNQERLVNSVINLNTNTLDSKLNNLFKNEFKSNVIPSLEKMFDPVADKLQADLSHKMLVLESNMKENIQRFMKSKVMVETFSNAISTAVQTQVAQAYHNAFQTVFFPMFEKTSKVMFEQLNENFQSGTKDYLLQVENQLKKRKDVDEKALNINKNHLLNINENIGALTSSVNVQQQILSEVQKAVSNQQEALCSSVINAMRSGAVTPVPTVESMQISHQSHQQQIRILVKQGQINAAFQQALSASDLSLVIYVCQFVDSNDVFTQNPCPLDQPVILSLIQQLSTDLSSDTELKHKYLYEALLNIDCNHEVTKSHLSSILHGLCQKLEQFIKSNADVAMNKEMKMLLMAAKSSHLQS